MRIFHYYVVANMRDGAFESGRIVDLVGTPTLFENNVTLPIPFIYYQVKGAIRPDSHKCFLAVITVCFDRRRISQIWIVAHGKGICQCRLLHSLRRKAYRATSLAQNVSCSAVRQN